MDASGDASAADAAHALFVSATSPDALSSLSRAAREAVAGATACVCAGLDGDGDAALAVLRLVVVDALALDENGLRAVAPLAAAPPQSAEDLERGVRSARDAFVFLSIKPTDEPIEPIDWSVVVASLLVKLASLGRHDARAAACLRRLARAAAVEWARVAAVEDLLARQLRNALNRAAETAENTADEEGQTAHTADEREETREEDTASARPPPRRDWAGASREKNTAARPVSDGSFFSFSAMRETLKTVKDMGYGRAAAVGAAAAFGGGLMFVSGGAAAPAVLASLASLSAAGGVLGAVALSAGTLVASFGGATGIAYALGGVGAGLTGWRAARRLEGLSQFAFLPLRGTGEGMRVFLYVPGFLRDPGDLFKSFGVNDGVYSAVVEVRRRDGVFSRDERDDDARDAEYTPTPVSADGTNVPNRSGLEDEDERGDVSRRPEPPRVSPWRILSDAVAELRPSASYGDAKDEETAERRARARDETIDVPSIGVALADAKSRGGGGGARVTSVVPGGVADAAGIAEGSVIVSAAFVRDDDSDDSDASSSRNDEDETTIDFAFARRGETVRGRRGGQAHAVAALFARAELVAEKAAARETKTRPQDPQKYPQKDPQKDPSETRPSGVRVELRLRRNLSRGADVEALARRRARRAAPREPQRAAGSAGSETDPMRALAAASPLSSASTASLGLDAARSVDEDVSSMPSSEKSEKSEKSSEKTKTTMTKTQTETKEEPSHHDHSWPLPRGEQLVVAWEHALLMDLGGAMSAFGRAAMTRYVGAQAVAHTSLAALASAVAWPVTLLNAGSFIDSPWALAESRGAHAGRALADALLEGSGKGAPRPVTVVAYSLGCDVARHACAVLDATENGLGLGLIQDLVLVGAPLDASRETWLAMRRVAAGRVVNAGDFSDTVSRDWMLRFLFRKKNWALGARGVAAWTRVDHPGVENVDVGEACGAHVEIPDRMGDILRVVGLDA